MKIFSQTVGHRQALQKRRRLGAWQRHWPLMAAAAAVLILYVYMIPDALLARLFSSGSSSEHPSNGDRGRLTSDSRVRIERVAPEKWTIDDVGVWLGKEVSHVQQPGCENQNQ